MEKIEKIDRLFLRANCIECSRVRQEFDYGKVVDDDFRGRHGQELRVFSVQSLSASSELLGKFGLSGKEMPVILTFDGGVIEKSKNVILHLRRNGMD